MPHSFQKAGLAMLLSAPSTLRKKWRDADQAGFEDELERLGFAPEVIAIAKESKGKLDPHLDSFNAVATQLRDNLWDGGEPHPPDPGAAAIISALRGMDEADPGADD